ALKALALALPEDLLRPSAAGQKIETGKYALSRMARESGLLPDAVIDQPKVAAVDAPIDAWYAGPLRARMEGWLAGLPFRAHPASVRAMLSGTGVERLFKRMFRERVMSHAPSLLATYARFTALAGRRGADRPRD
ncbi:MAG: asparagine synthase-related protein, partial [Pseudomonadota bacterium]